MSDKPEPTSREKNPVCPWCGKTVTGAYELRDDQETDCGWCLKPIYVSRYTTVTYTTYPITPDGVVHGV